MNALPMQHLHSRTIHNGFLFLKNMSEVLSSFTVLYLIYYDNFLFMSSSSQETKGELIL